MENDTRDARNGRKFAMERRWSKAANACEDKLVAKTRNSGKFTLAE
jgi:hypothetical protein